MLVRLFLLLCKKRYERTNIAPNGWSRRVSRHNLCNRYQLLRVNVTLGIVYVAKIVLEFSMYISARKHVSDASPSSLINAIINDFHWSHQTLLCNRIAACRIHVHSNVAEILKTMHKMHRDLCE